MTRLEELRQVCFMAQNGWTIHLPESDLAALLDVAEAANEALENAIPAPRYGECIIEHGALGIALAPLTEEADNG